MVTLDDFEVDFDAAFDALIKQCAKELEGLSPRELVFRQVAKSGEHLAKLHAFDAPDFLIKRAFRQQRLALRRLRDFQREAGRQA